LCMQALEWGMPIMSVINKSYVVNNRGTDRIAYESQLIHAVIEKNAPLKNRLRYEILGAGDERRCRVWATFKGEDKPHEYISETLANLRGARGKNDAGQIKGSPLWETLPEVQMFYSASRQWARLFCPDVILGAYTPEDTYSSEPIDVTPDKITDLSQRLRNAKIAAADRGFDNADVVRQVGSIIEGDKQEAEHGDNERDVEGRSGGGADRSRDTDDKGASAGPVGGTEEAGEAVAGPGAQVQAEIFPPDREKPKGKGKGRK